LIESILKCVFYHMKTRNKVLIMGSNDEIVESMKNNLSKFIESDLIATSTQIPIESDAYSSLNCKLLLLVENGAEDYYTHEELFKHGIDVIIFDKDNGKSKYALVIDVELNEFFNKMEEFKNAHY